MKHLIACGVLTLVLLTSAYAQNVTNMLGTNGTFSIKNGLTEYFTLSQSTGDVSIAKTLRLETTTGTNVGVLYMGADKFLHNFGFGCLHFGANSGNAFNLGAFNTAVGHSTLFFNTSGAANSVFGYIAMPLNTTGGANSAFGFVSLFFNTTGSYNAAFGSTSLVNNTTGMYNSAFGDSALALNTTGDSNSAFGHLSLGSNTTGSQNSAFGRSSLRSNTTGSFNTALGHISGSNITTGSNLTQIGYASQPTTGTATNQFTLGNNTLQFLRCNVTSITSLSDARDKRNIKDLSLGIDFLMKLKPRTFNWDKREWYGDNVSDGTKIQEAPTAGFIAQELDEIQTTAGAEWLNLVLKDNPEKWEATAGNLLPVIVKAVQELRLENEKLKNENDELINESKEFESILSELEEAQAMLTLEIEKMKPQEVNEVKLPQSKLTGQQLTEEKK
jgi:trimeric autotransporter adhesin